MNRPFPEKLVDTACAVAIFLAGLYFLGHVVAAWLRGSFEVTR